MTTPTYRIIGCLTKCDQSASNDESKTTKQILLREQDCLNVMTIMEVCVGDYEWGRWKVIPTALHRIGDGDGGCTYDVDHPKLK